MNQNKLLRYLASGWHCEEPKAQPGTYTMYAILYSPEGVRERVERVPRSLLSAMARAGLLRKRVKPGGVAWYATASGLDVGRTA